MYPSPYPRKLILTERQTDVSRLAPADVEFLLEYHRSRVKVMPEGRHRYRLTAKGCAGVLSGPTCRFIIRPKIPLANLFAMLDPLADVPSESDHREPRRGTEALNFLAGQLARRMTERVAAGLHRAYREEHERGAVLHGRLDLPAQMRETPGRKDLLHSQYEELSVDVSCNQFVKATAERLAASPLLGREVRGALRQALGGFESVSTGQLPLRVWSALEWPELPAEYRPILDLCRLLGQSLTVNEWAGHIQGPSFLLDLERVFEMHVSRAIVEEFAQSRNYTVAVQEGYSVNQPAADLPNLTIRPDVTINCDGRTAAVIDAKWKKLWAGPEPPDLYQVLAYGATLRAEGVVLVYPGNRWSLQEHRFTHTPLRLTICTLRVGGTREACVRSVRRLARALKDQMV